MFVFSEVGKGMELDIFLPTLSIAFEYQGKHHYEDTMVYGVAAMYQRRDLNYRQGLAHTCRKRSRKKGCVPEFINHTHR